MKTGLGEGTGCIVVFFFLVLGLLLDSAVLKSTLDVIV